MKLRNTCMCNIHFVTCQNIPDDVGVAMASAAPSFALLHGSRASSSSSLTDQITRRRMRVELHHSHGGHGHGGSSFRVVAAAASATGGPNPKKRSSPPEEVDTRIHWENEDEGWIGASSKKSSSNEQQQLKEEDVDNNFLGKKFADLLKDATDSHYEFLRISPDSDLEEIKAAYRRLSKEYHPDTTSLPIKVASEKFLKLKQVYNVLSDDESRRFYDWTLAQEAASRQAEKMRMSLEDPYIQDVENFESVPDMVDRLGGKNMELSDQAMSALTIDIAIIIFAICCIIYVIYFKEPY